MNQPCLALSLLVLLSACTTPADRLRSMYERDQAAVTSDGGLGSRQKNVPEQLARHRGEVNEMAAKGELETSEDYFHAGYILCLSDSMEDLAKAEEYGLRAAELGDDRGFRIAAEAVDRQCVKRQDMQRYGTQFVYEHVNRSWRLYPVDPRTTDVERKAWGVEPMAELMRMAERLNETPELDLVKGGTEKE